MDIIALNASNFSNGVIVNGIKSVKWIERWQEAGEFTIKAEPSETILTQLALGTCITHINTLDVMMVEDHEIDESEDEVTLTITGRSLVGVLLDIRTGSPTNFGQINPSTGKEYLYDMPSATLVLNLRDFMQDQLTFPRISGSDVVPNLSIVAGFTGTDTPSEIVFKRGQFASEVQNTLLQLDAGLKFERSTTTASTITIHKGVDVSTSVIFSSEYGDLENTRYFWSNRKYRNSALVAAKYYALVQRASGLSGLDMRVMYVDAGDYDFNPVGATTAELLAADRILAQRANFALAAQRVTQLLETDIKPSNRWVFRRDYNIGDIVYVKGNYGVAQKMRVVEFAEFDDETGEVGVPTVKPLAS